MKKQSIDIIPLGGLSKIGSNICCFNVDDVTFAIDAGIRFPDTEHFDLNYSLPNLESIQKIDYLLITHCHEDHIGGVHKVIEEFPSAIIITTPFNDYLVKEKLHKNQTTAKVEVIEEHTKYTLGKELSIEFVHVNHSIPFTKGVHIETRDSSILFISDFKIENHGRYEKPLDLKYFKKLGEFKKYKIAMLDSTSIFTTKRSTDENNIYHKFEQLIGTVNNKIFVTTFASNLYRLISVIEIAHKFKKKILLKSPSMIRFIDVGLRYNLIDEKIIKKTILTNEKKVPDNCIILLSGSQGEKKSALRNLLFNSRPFTKINDGDVFCFSSKIIPGNEKGVFNIYDEITKKGGVILNDRNGFHSSGHADQSDLFEVYNSYAPTHAIPVHGTVYFLDKHTQFITEKFPSIKTINALNFDRITIKEDIKFIPKKKREIEEYKYFFGKQSKYIPIENINERKKVAEKGLVSICAKKKRGGKVQVHDIKTLGLPEIDGPNWIKLKEALNEYDISGSNSEQQIREALNKYFEQHLGCRPKSLLHIF